MIFHFPPLLFLYIPFPRLVFPLPPLLFFSSPPLPPLSHSLTLSLPSLLSLSLLLPPTQRIRMPEDVHIDHVSCGSAHTICWSSIRRKVVCQLPENIPMELNQLHSIPVYVLRNRLILLHHFSNLFCKSLSLFSLQPKPVDVSSVGGVGEGAFEGFDQLRGVLVSSAKVCRDTVYCERSKHFREINTPMSV